MRDLYMYVTFVKGSHTYIGPVLKLVFAHIRAKLSDERQRRICVFVFHIVL